MKKILKILVRIFFVFIILTLLVFVIRKVNAYRYKEYMIEDENEVYTDPADLSLYDTEIEDVQVETIEEGLLNGFHLVPDSLTKKGVIVTFGGSEGSSNYEVAELLAQEGYEVYSLFYFGPGELPDELVEVPLELFDDFLTYHAENSQSEGPLTVLGASKGAELTLNLAARYEEIDHILLYAPSAYSFFSLDQQNSNKSSWTYKGEEVPYLSNRDGKFSETMKMIGGLIFYYPVRYEPVYRSVIEGTADADLESARIKAEDFKGDGVIFAGGDDLMWSSERMAEEIEKQNSHLETHIYSEAGHLFSMDRYMGTSGILLAFGGDEKENQQAQKESNAILFKHLEEWHQ